MIKTALLPFLLSGGLYLAIGCMTVHGSGELDLETLFGQEFQLHWAALLPAVLIFVLSLCRVRVKKAMLISIVGAIGVCLVLQGRTPVELLQTALFGYTAAHDEVGVMLNGGGIISMLRVGAIVCLSSSFSGIFQKTGLLDGIKSGILTLSRRTSVYGAMLGVSVLVGMLACNQTLTIMLTHQLCGDLTDDKERLALDLEDTAVVVAPLIPWSIAGAVPLTAVGAPMLSLGTAFFLYLLPLCRLLTPLPLRSSDN